MEVSSQKLATKKKTRHTELKTRLTTPCLLLSRRRPITEPQLATSSAAALAPESSHPKLLYRDNGRCLSRIRTEAAVRDDIRST
jgi:hypothetical protein